MSNIKTPTAYFINQGYFLDNKMVDQMFGLFENHLKNNHMIGLNSEKIDISLSLTDYNREKKRGGPRTFAFTIKGNDEFRYAVNLLKMYKTVVKPYFLKNKKIIKKHSQNFDRVFAIVGNLNSFALGKTM